jgi:hypothetical protein
MRHSILWLALAGAALPAEATAAAAQVPPCVPATLGGSALLAGAITVSPAPGSRDATPQTQISLLGAPAARLAVQSVTGSVTGPHAGRLLPYSQGDGASFLPARPFAEGERVTVRAQLRGPGPARTLLDSFEIARADPLAATPEPIHPGPASEQQAFRSRPDLHPPVVHVSTDDPGAEAADILLAPYSGPGQAGPMILDPGGVLLWFKPLPARLSASNLRVQEWEGHPVLTWWQGVITIHGFGVGADEIVDSGYRTVAHVLAGNGLQADLHEFQLAPRGTALITAYDPLLCDLSSIGGPRAGAVTDGVVQEVDVHTGLVRMQWTSLDHVALGESYERPQTSSTSRPFDFFHVNSIADDPDGSLLVSARNTWTVYEISPATGQVLWRLGGRNSSFREQAAARTAWQHDPRMLPNGTISIFDNGSSPTVHRQSRGIVLRLDPAAGSATLVGEVAHGPPVIAPSQGNMELLPHGDWFVGWGQAPELSEFDPAGELVFDAKLPLHTQSYRSFRFPWAGLPVHAPTFSFSPSAAGGTVWASWNGATGVGSWRVLAGPTPAQLAPVAQAARTGFETPIALPAPAPGPYLAVQALDAAGSAIGASTAVSATTGGAG